MLPVGTVDAGQFLAVVVGCRWVAVQLAVAGFGSSEAGIEGVEQPPIMGSVSLIPAKAASTALRRAMRAGKAETSR